MLSAAFLRDMHCIDYLYPNHKSGKAKDGPLLSRYKRHHPSTVDHPLIAPMNGNFPSRSNRTTVFQQLVIGYSSIGPFNIQSVDL